MMLLTGILQVLGAEPIPLVFERLPLDIRSNEFYKRGLAWQFRTEENDEIYEVKHSIFRVYLLGFAVVVYESGHCS